MLVAYSANAQAYLKDFLEHLPTGMIPVIPQAKTWRLNIVTADLLSRNDLADVQDNRWTILHKAWSFVESTWRGASLLTFDQESKRDTVDFVYLINRKQTPAEVRSLLGIYVLNIERRWLAQQGWLLLHASAIARSGRGFLFLGKSDAGKTTVARLSQGIADAILHDDRVFVAARENGYSLRGAPQSGANISQGPESHQELVSPSRNSGFASEIPLCATFILKKDERDYLAPVKELSVAHALIDAFLIASAGLVTAPQGLRAVMHTLCEISRRVPRYELHFRKHPGFWKVIDAEFGL